MLKLLIEKYLYINISKYMYIFIEIVIAYFAVYFKYKYN